MMFSKSYKNLITREGLYVVRDVTAQQLKDLKIPYKSRHDWSNWVFIVSKEHLPKLINLVEDRHKTYWQEKIDKEVA